MTTAAMESYAEEVEDLRSFIKALNDNKIDVIGSLRLSWMEEGMEELQAALKKHTETDPAELDQDFKIQMGNLVARMEEVDIMKKPGRKERRAQLRKIRRKMMDSVEDFDPLRQKFEQKLQRSEEEKKAQAREALEARKMRALEIRAQEAEARRENQKRSQ